MVSLAAVNVCPAKRSAVAIISSAGAIPALIELLANLPSTFPFPIIVAQHLPPIGRSVLPAILTWRGHLAVKWAERGEVAQGGVVYLVPPGHQLEFRLDGFVISALAPCSSSWLASPDVLLRSLAASYGAGAIVVVLSGTIAVGIAGIRAITRGGGITMVQNRSTSLFFEMPIGAIDQGKAELVLSPPGIAEALLLLAE
jgi:chemotaxis response regulator CheB